MRSAPIRRARRAPKAAPKRLRLELGEHGSGERLAALLGPPCIVACAVLLGWVAFAKHPVGDYFTESDFYGSYSEGARLIRRGVLDPSRYGVVGPAYEALLAVVSLAIPDLFSAARALSVLASTVTLVSLWRVLKRRLDATAGLWTALLLAVNPIFVRYGFSATTDATASGFQAAALLAGFGVSWRGAPIVSGALAGMATLTRYNALAWSGGLAAALALEPVDRRARLRSLAGFAAGFLLVVAPWTAYSLAHGHVPGERLISGSGFFTTSDASRNLQDRPVDEPSAVPDSTRRSSIPANLVDHLRRDLLETVGLPVAVLCALGVVAVTAARRWRRMAPLWLPGLASFLALVPIFYSDRYSLPHLAVLMAFAGTAVALLRIEWRAGATAIALGWAVAAVPLAFGARTAVLRTRDVLSQQPVEVPEAGLALHALAPPDARVVSRKPHIAYYSGRLAVAFPRLRTLPELAAWCRAHHADYLFFSWYEAELRPEFWALLDTTRVAPGLRVLHVTDRNPSVLYRLGPEFGQVPDWWADPATRNLQAARAQIRVLEPDKAWQARVLLGLDALDHGRPAEAETHFFAVTPFPEGRAQGWLGWGEARLRLGHPDDAIRAFRTVLSLAPDNRLARERLGLAQAMSGDAAGAARTWQPVLDTTRDPAVLQTMLSVYGQLGDAASAARVRAAMGR